MSGDTIFALSSAPGRAGVSVVRVSGARAFASFATLTKSTAPPVPRHALFAAVYDPKDDALIDRALVIPFAAPASFTGENVVEYQLHGSPAVVSALLAALQTFDDHRMAAPGEFTRRAFQNGKLDLTEAEAVADLINAETEQQRIQALSQMDGALSRLYEDWRARLVKAMAYVETVIDFPDEDIPDEQVKTVFPALEILKADIAAHLNDGRRGERLRSGISVAILGAPNAGKSSLLNALTGREQAIVSPMAGTTRDVIEAHLDIAGYPVILADTAGLRAEDLEESGHGAVEGEGIRRALARAGEADLTILVFDGTASAPDARTLSLINDDSIIVLTRHDSADFVMNDDAFGARRGNVAAISTTTGGNLDTLVSLLARQIKKRYERPLNAAPVITRARHRDALLDCLAHLSRALQAARPEMLAEDLRLAARSLGRITGRVEIDDLLDVIFRDFCIGK